MSDLGSQWRKSSERGRNIDSWDDSGSRCALLSPQPVHGTAMQSKKRKWVVGEQDGAGCTRSWSGIRNQGSVHRESGIEGHTGQDRCEWR